MKIGEFCLKQLVQGWHCVQMRSLPVSTMPRVLKGGVPIERFMRYSPEDEVNWDWIVFGEEERLEARESERWIVLWRRWNLVSDGL